MPLHILPHRFPVPLAPNARLKAVGMNHGKSKDYPDGLNCVNSNQKDNSGVHAVQNVGREEGFAGVMTSGVNDCCAVALVEVNKQCDSISRISMVHVASSLDIIQLQDLSSEMLKNFKALGDTYDRRVIILPGRVYQKHDIWTETILNTELRKEIATLFQVTPDNVLSTLDTPEGGGNYSACITFEGFVGDVEHFPFYPVGKSDITVEATLTKSSENSEFNPRLCKITKEKYINAFRAFGIGYPNTDKIISIIEKDPCDELSKINLYYLAHRQIAEKFTQNNHFEQRFKNEINDLAIFTYNQKSLLGLFTVCLITGANSFLARAVSGIGLIGVTSTLFYYTNTRQKRNNLCDEVLQTSNNEKKYHPSK